jgi:hypothetical protein
MTTLETTTPIKLFISHASEDKADFVDPLTAALEMAGFDLWYDKDALKLSDSLFQRISRGLGECDYGIVVLSSSFFEKKWTQAELGGLFALETAERKLIIPIWKGVTEESVKKFSPLLADRLGIRAEAGVDVIVEEIMRLVQVSERTSSFSSIENEIARFAALDREVAGAREARKLTDSVEGVQRVGNEAKELIATLRAMVSQLSEAAENLKLVIKSEKPFELFASGSFNVDLIMQYRNSAQNSISRDDLSFRVYQRGIDQETGMDKNREIFRCEFKPQFHHTGLLLWCSTTDSGHLSTEKLGIVLLGKIVDVFKEIHERHERSNSR